MCAAVDPVVSLSTYSTLPGGAGEDTAVDAHAERSTRVHWFGCGVRLPSPQGLASGGSSRGR